MKKKIYIGALVLTCGLIIGCADSAPSAQEMPYETAGQTAVEMPELSAERELQIRENFHAWDRGWSLDEYVLTHYYGTFNGGEVVGITRRSLLEFRWNPGTATIRQEYVAGYSFEFSWWSVFGGNYENCIGWAPDEFTVGGLGDIINLWLHKDGEFMCFCVGYERGYLTAEDIGLIWERHQHMPDLPKLNLERGLQLRDSFHAWAFDNIPVWESITYPRISLCGEGSVLCLCEERGGPYLPWVSWYYGTFDGREIVFIVGAETWETAGTREYVAGYLFSFSSRGLYDEHSDNWQVNPGGGVRIWLHDDGDWMCFCVGYERGYLTAEDIGLIWARHPGSRGE